MRTQKDLTEKILADYNDVFADIVNVLLFHGEQVISPEDLENVKDRSQYKADGRVHEQERDVAKLLKRENTIISLVGFEHQTKAEKFMPMRQIGYDGQSYRAQLLDKNTKRIYPVVTLILYFGTIPWNYSRHLTELMDIPEAFRPYVSDYEMKNLYEIAFLTPEQVKLFRSDFRYIADYLVQKRMTNDYRPKDSDRLEHTDAMLKLMSVLTGSSRFEEMIPELSEEGGTTMCEVIDRLINDGIKKGLTQGKLEGTIATLAVLVKDGTLSLSRAAQIANLSEAEFISFMNHLA